MNMPEMPPPMTIASKSTSPAVCGRSLTATEALIPSSSFTIISGLDLLVAFPTGRYFILIWTNAQSFQAIRSARSLSRKPKAFRLDRPIIWKGPGWPLPPPFDLPGELCLGALERIARLAPPPEIGQRGGGKQVRREELRPQQHHLAV